jgi:hypothetical protein
MRHLSVRRLSVVVALGALVMLFATGAQAATSFFNGFETDTAGWTPLSASTITRVASGDTSTTYASGVSAATGGYYARLGKDTAPGSCVNGGGTQPVYNGSYTQFAGYESTFPTAGYSTAVDVYLDVNYASANPDTRFDWDSAINDSSGNFLRDFVFNVATEPGGFVIAGSTNANRCGADPASGSTPVHMTASGWYTFKHTFTNVGGQLSVKMELIQRSSNAVMGTWTLSTDAISTVGGHRYGWFAQNEFDGLAIDNSTLSGLTPPCTATGFYRDGINLTAAQINPGGTVSGTVDATGCNIGVYYGPDHTGTVGAATISGANYYGVVVDRAAVNVNGATIQDIGETQPNGSQHGVGVFYTTRELTSDPSNTVFTTAGAATGTLSNSTIRRYQKNGVVVSGMKAAVIVNKNTVTGFGPVNYIAQNGVEIAADATATITGNTVSGHFYTPATVTACGLLFFQAGGVKQSGNIFSGNQTNLCNAGRGGGGFNA